MYAILYLIAVAIAAYVPSENWSTLTPDAAPTATTNYEQKFGIQIETISAAPSAPAKREVNQIGDGQIQNPTATHDAVTKVINQIGDGQIQNQPTASVINQIGDGQIQNQQNPAPPAPTASVINQIGDGQIQNQQNPAPTASVVGQIGDGQIQNQPSAAPSVAAQIDDGQIQNQGSAKLQTCGTDNSLSMTLKDSVLRDSLGRIGAIVANRQFQFDGPPPQAGSIYAAGWSIEDGYLALGNNDTFYQCLSGDFYNLYDQDVADQCAEVKLAIVDLIDC